MQKLTIKEMEERAAAENAKLTAEDINKMIERAIQMRKKAYKIRAPRLFIQDINRDIRNLTARLSELEA